MFFSGMIAERVSLRYFLALGMLFSGFFCYSFGYAKTNDIHSMVYFVIVQGLAGIFQTTGWPGVVSVVSRWCGKSKRGLIFGIWNSHTSIGNMLGTYIAAHYVDSDWSMSFIVPGFIMGVMG
jgi:MFS transporter, OPA family, solute carrier family 37 (glycerol-3-phosphate transporter), member 1/2